MAEATLAALPTLDVVHDLYGLGGIEDGAGKEPLRGAAAPPAIHRLWRLEEHHRLGGNHGRPRCADGHRIEALVVLLEDHVLAVSVPLRTSASRGGDLVRASLGKCGDVHLE